MWKRFNKTDRRILSLALLLLLLFSYLLYDDSLLFPDGQTTNLKKIGAISYTDKDVRKKVSKQFVWKSAKDRDKVYLGDSLFTGKESSAKVQLDSGKELVVQPNSLISFASVDGQFMFDLQFGKISGEIKGNDCIKILVHGKPTEVCGENAKLELDADGSVNVLAGTADLKGKGPVKKATDAIKWSKAPAEKFYHYQHQAPMNLAWTAETYYGRYHVQFSKQKDFGKISFEQIYQGKTATLKNYPKTGKYYVRIQADNAKGEASGFSQARLTEIAEVQAPVILTPTINQTLSFRVNADGEPLEPNRAQISWNYHNPQAQIEIQIATDPEFKNIETSQITTTGQQALSAALQPGLYYLRLKDAEQKDGVSLPWSEMTSFTVVNEAPNKMIAPVLLTTDIKYFGPDANPPKIRWTKVNDAQKYLVEISPTTNFKEKQSFTTTDLNFAYKNYYLGDFYVRVSAATEKETLGVPSNIGTLLIRAKRPILDPVEPKIVMGKSSEDMGEPVDFNVSWSEQKFAEKYLVQLSKDPQFKEKIQIESETPASVMKVPEPGDFYWRVQGLDRGGKAITQFSETGKINYTLKVPLAQPDLIEPLNDITLFFQKRMNPYFWLEWKPVRQASLYKLEISTSESFDNIVFTKDVTTSRFLVKEKLPQGTLYWRVRAESDQNRLSFWTPARKMSIYSGRTAQDGDQR